MHAVTFTVSVHFAVGTLAFAGPFAVTVRLELIVPDVDEFVFVDISLMEVGTDTRTTGNGPGCPSGKQSG